MNLNSIYFIFIMLPLFLAVYWIVPQKHRNAALLVMSFLSYFWAEPVFSLILLMLSFFCYVMTKTMKNDKERSKQLMIEAIAVFSFVLIYFKYYEFIVDNISAAIGINLEGHYLASPLGISFIVFGLISYIVDMYRGEEGPENLTEFLLYIFFFPKMAMGPIARFTGFKNGRVENLNSQIIADSIRRFILGLSKKVILADTFAMIFSNITGDGSMSTAGAWLAALAFTFQIYYDFSGYTDMAIGIAMLFGYRLPENFNYPYQAVSIRDFWKRWHMTLSGWFRDYIYIPLGGNRKGSGRTVLNMLAVWAFTGLWHGASWNFIFWGLYFFILLVMEKYVFSGIAENCPKKIRKIITFILIMISWVIFAYEDTDMMVLHLKNMFVPSELYDGESLWNLKNYFLFFVMGFAGMSPFVRDNIIKYDGNKKYYVAVNVVILAIFAVSVAYLVGSSFKPFLYVQF